MAAQKSNTEAPQADQISFEALNKDLLYLESIRDCLERIAEYTAAGKQAFLDPRLIQDGVIRNLEVIGEALVFHLQGLAVVAGALAYVALHVDVGQVYLDHLTQFSHGAFTELFGIFTQVCGLMCSRGLEGSWHP